MKLSGAILLISLIFRSLPVNAEVGELNNPLWEEVPNTHSSKAIGQYARPAFVDINGIIQKGETVIFDLVNPDASYARVEANCKTNQFRAIRQGDFESKTRIHYARRINSWNFARGEYQQALLNFICSPSES